MRQDICCINHYKTKQSIMWSQFNIKAERNLKDLWMKNLLSLKPITVFKRQPKVKKKREREHVENGYPPPHFLVLNTKEHATCQGFSQYFWFPAKRMKWKSMTSNQDFKTCPHSYLPCFQFLSHLNIRSFQPKATYKGKTPNCAKLDLNGIQSTAFVFPLQK